MNTIKSVGFWRFIGAAAGLALFVGTMMPAGAEQLTLAKGTHIKLAFDTAMSSKTTKVGDKVKLHVDEPVSVNGKTVIKEGTKVTGTISAVNKRAKFGVNAKIQMKLNPIMTISGKQVSVGFKTRGANDKSNTIGAGAASAGGAAVLGPIGLVGGYFITGKQVVVKPGDKTTVDTDKAITVNVK